MAAREEDDRREAPPGQSGALARSDGFGRSASWARPPAPSLGRVRARCPGCDRSEALSLAAVQSPAFDFFCPSCGALRVVEDEGEPEPVLAPLPRPRVEPPRVEAPRVAAPREAARPVPARAALAPVEPPRREPASPRVEAPRPAPARPVLAPVEPPRREPEPARPEPARPPEPTRLETSAEPSLVEPPRTRAMRRVELEPVAPPSVSPEPDTPGPPGSVLLASGRCAPWARFASPRPEVLRTSTGSVAQPATSPAPTLEEPPRTRALEPLEPRLAADALALDSPTTAWRGLAPEETAAGSLDPPTTAGAWPAPAPATTARDQDPLDPPTTADDALDPPTVQDSWALRARRDAAEALPAREIEGGEADPFAVLAAEVQAAIFAERRDAPGVEPAPPERPTERHEWPAGSLDDSLAGSLDDLLEGSLAFGPPAEPAPTPAPVVVPAVYDEPRGPETEFLEADEFLAAEAEGDVGPAEPPEPDAFDGIDVVELAGETRGTGSRTYDAGPTPFPAPPAPAVPAPRDPGAHSKSGVIPRPPLPSPRSSGSFAPPPPPPRGSPPADDQDWFALIDEALPETAADGPDPSHVVIHLPEALAPRSPEDPDARTLLRIQGSLEARGLEKGPDIAAAAAGEDELPDEREAPEDGTHEDEAEPVAGPALPSSASPEATAALKPPGAAAPTSLEPTPPPRTSSTGRVRPSPSGPSKSSSGPLPAKAVTPGDPKPSDRAPAVELEPAPPPPASAPPPAIVIEQFNRDDLDPCLVCARDPSSPEADAIAQVYQTIFHPRPGPSGHASAPRMILVTSARRGEGKTTVAANLAIVAARLPGRGALLVAADPRGGDLLRVFGLGMKREGLLEALGGGGDPMRFVLRLKLGNLDVLPLGVAGSDAAELISSDRIGEVIHGLAARYPSAAVILDGSAVLHAPDPLVLARQVDGVVLVVRADATAQKDVERARDLIGPERILGVVLNHASNAVL